MVLLKSSMVDGELESSSTLCNTLNLVCPHMGVERTQLLETSLISSQSKTTFPILSDESSSTRDGQKDFLIE